MTGAAATTPAVIPAAILGTDPRFRHSLQTTESPDEVWARVEGFIQRGPNPRRLKSESRTLLIWEFPSTFSTLRYEAHLAPTELGSSLGLQLELRGPLGWFFRLMRSRRYGEELRALARSLAGGRLGC